MSRIQVDEWAADAPWKNRYENENLWTITTSCDHLEGEHRRLKCHQPAGGTQNIDPDRFKKMETRSYMSNLVIETERGKEMSCSRISSAPRNKVRCSRRDEDSKEVRLSRIKKITSEKRK